MHNEFYSASYVHSLPWISCTLGNFMHLSESSRCPQLLRSGVLSPQVRESTRQNARLEYVKVPVTLLLSLKKLC